MGVRGLEHFDNGRYHVIDFPEELPERGRLRALYAHINRLSRILKTVIPGSGYRVRTVRTANGTAHAGNPAGEETGGEFPPTWIP